MDTVWVVTYHLMSDDSSDLIVAAFTDKESALAFEQSHERWLKNMELDGFTDCYPVPLNPEYTDEGYVAVEKRGGKLTTKILPHITRRWDYIAQPDEVVQQDGYERVIVKATSCSEAKRKATSLFAQNNQNTYFVNGDEGNCQVRE